MLVVIRYAMQLELDKKLIKTAMSRLKKADPDFNVFGSSTHKYRLRRPLNLAVLESYERTHNCRFPEDYRYFITEVGNGGAGPFYGVMPFDTEDADIWTRSWDDTPWIGDLSKPFPHTAAWNIDASFWDQQPTITDEMSEDEEERIMNDWYALESKTYYSADLMNGAVPICHMGCLLRLCLVVTGELKGYVWEDRRVDCAGLRPLQDDAENDISFRQWYLTWLGETLRNCKIKL